MSDQYPPYPPSDGYIQQPVPAATPDPAAAVPSRQTLPQGPPSGSSKKTAIIVAVVAAVLLLCCCVSSAAFFFFAADEDPNSISDVIGLPPDDSARMEEWLAWEPELTDDALSEAPADKSALIAESLSIVAPDFEADETWWMEGYYVEEEDWYYSDYVVVTARHPSSDDLWAGIEFSLQSDAMIAEGIPFEPEEGDVVTTIADGAYELLYYPQWDEGIDESLWEQIGADWPDAVVMDIHDSNETPGAMEAEITNRDAYAIEGSSPRVYVTYEQAGDGGWRLSEWQYWYPEEDGGAPDEDRDDGSTSFDAT